MQRDLTGAVSSRLQRVPQSHATYFRGGMRMAWAKERLRASKGPTTGGAFDSPRSSLTSHRRPWKQLRVSLGKTGAPRTHVPSSAKEMSYSPKARPTECHRNLQWQQPELRFEEAPRPALQSHQKTSAASTRPQ